MLIDWEIPYYRIYVGNYIIYYVVIPEGKVIIQLDFIWRDEVHLFCMWVRKSSLKGRDSHTSSYVKVGFKL